MNPLTPAEALQLIHAHLDATQWSGDTLETIAAIVTAAGFKIRAPDTEES